MSSSARPDATPGNLPPRSDSRARHHRTLEIPSGQHSTASSRRYQRHSPENTALCLERLSTNAAGQVVYQLKIPFRDGTTHILFSREEFFARPCRPTRRTRSTRARQPHPIPWRLRPKLAHAPRDVRLSAHSKSISLYAALRRTVAAHCGRASCAAQTPTSRKPIPRVRQHLQRARAILSILHSTPLAASQCPATGGTMAEAVNMHDSTCDDV